ncbi:MAG: NYN domain-containing protein [Clostridia bacterium]|nr:NYN domain-containing protein [Clostridia bacterium]
MADTKKNAILLIDGDNISGALADSIYEAAKEYGRIKEIHLFANFKGADAEWSLAAYRHAMAIHHLPVIIAKKNITDIGLTIIAMEKLFEAPDIDVYIIASNDSDYMPLASEIRGHGKTAVNLYTTKDNIQQLAAYDTSRYVEKNAVTQDDADKVLAESVRVIIEVNSKKTGRVMLNKLSQEFKKKITGFDIKKSYKKPCSSLRIFLTTLKADYPDLFAEYDVTNDYVEHIKP